MLCFSFLCLRANPLFFCLHNVEALDQSDVGVVYLSAQPLPMDGRCRLANIRNFYFIQINYWEALASEYDNCLAVWTARHKIEIYTCLLNFLGNFAIVKGSEEY